tara:strand:+ start:2589 stop:2780 length:192 start_codon:yes stop_codon:yes gene_type:complete
MNTEEELVEKLVGMTLNEARFLLGERLYRTINENFSMLTMDYNPERYNLELDENDIIVGCWTG